MKREQRLATGLDLEEIFRHHADVQAALKLYFDSSSSNFQIRFSGESSAAVVKRRNARLQEADRQAALVLLSGIEAAFHLDYRKRVEKRFKDPLSRAFRALSRDKGQNVKLDGDLFESWSVVSILHKRAIANLRIAFNFRHWMAHGRYWRPVPGRYDFLYLYDLALQTFELMGLDR